jgi:hypothetical protein
MRAWPHHLTWSLRLAQVSQKCVAHAQSEIDWFACSASDRIAILPLSSLRRSAVCWFGGFACSPDSSFVPTLTTQGSPASPAKAEANSDNFFLVRSVSFLAAAFSAAYKASSWGLGLIWLACTCIQLLHSSHYLATERPVVLHPKFLFDV